MTQLSQNRPTCAICGIRAATTRDHIPPRAVFVEPYPKNMITVPACSECNNGSNVLDAEFRVSISMNVGVDTPKTYALWRHYALRTLSKNMKFSRRILDVGRQVNVISPSGIYLGKAFAVPYSIRAHNTVIDRIVRGLFFHHFGRVLGHRAKVSSWPLKGSSAAVAETVKTWSAGQVGDTEFFYRFVREQGAPFNSVWVLVFYERYCVMAETRSKWRSNNPHDKDGTCTN